MPHVQLLIVFVINKTSYYNKHKTALKVNICTYNKRVHTLR